MPRKKAQTKGQNENWVKTGCETMAKKLQGRSKHQHEEIAPGTW